MENPKRKQRNLREREKRKLEDRNDDLYIGDREARIRITRTNPKLSDFWYPKNILYLYSGTEDLLQYYSILESLAANFGLARWEVEFIIFGSYDFATGLLTGETSLGKIDIDMILNSSDKELTRLIKRWATNLNGFISLLNNRQQLPYLDEEIEIYVDDD